MSSSGDRLTLERDLYSSLLRILEADDPAETLKEVLRILVGLANAERGYLELYFDPTADRRSWSLAHGCSASEESEIRAVTSRGIVASAIAAGTTVHTPLALLDARFAGSDSVRGQQLEAVLCVPLKGRTPGVLYLEGKRGKGPFPAEAIAVAEQTARFVAAAVERAGERAPGSANDPTQPYRSRLQLDPIVGRSAALAHVFEQVSLVAPLDVTVLITGPSGTGKTQLAQAIHANSRRRHGPFVELNCAAIPEGLIESELFGTMPSAFPGARRTVGKVEAAEGGTLFLDEIAEIPFAAQGKLLQLLQSKQYYPLASPRVAIANVRLIAATNADLDLHVAERRFREDLFYRLNILTVRMPGLSERREDIAPLIDVLTERISEEHQLARPRPSSAFYAACEATDWPGNVRQLRHKLEAAVIRASGEGASSLEPRHLEGTPRAASGGAQTFQEATRLFQRDLLRRELEANGWNVSEVARNLELTRSHVYNLIKSFGLTRSNARVPEAS